MIVLVCGGRTYGIIPPETPSFGVQEALRKARVEADALYAYLDAMHKRCPITKIVHGAQRGADTLAGEWARSRRVDCKPYPADWNKYKNLAGPIRNTEMLEKEKVDRVVACAGNSGTANMIGKARDAGIEVLFV